MVDEPEVPEVEETLRRGGAGKPAAPVDNGPIYSMVGEDKIPVSKSMGKLWQARRDQGISFMGDACDAWSEAVKYYNNDQMTHRTDGRTNRSANTLYSKRLNDDWTETENVVFSNVTTMLPILYSKSPNVEATPFKEDNKPFATLCEHVLQALLTMREAPGVNAKPRIRRGVITALLKNKVYASLRWTPKQDSDQTALEEINKLAKELEGAKTPNKIREIEGKLMALEETIDLLTPEGPQLRIVQPNCLVVDPSSSECDLSDAGWVMEEDYLPTTYLRAKYGQKQPDGSYKSIFNPTHVMFKGTDGEGNELDDAVNNFQLFTKDDASLYGYDTPEAYNAAQRTKVWWVWDKTTRRVYLFHDKDWSWPIWVWNDPYKLLGFFPYFEMHFHESVDGRHTKGEVTYYLDQQDAINEINDELRRSRRWAKRNVLFNINAIGPEDVEAVLKGVDGTARGVDVPEGQTIDDALFTMTPPAIKYAELFDTASKFEAINRISSVDNVMRGVEFKVNTTNDAVASYRESSEIRIDEKVDAIEDWIGVISWNLLQMAIQFMSAETVVSIVGPEGAAWKNMTPDELRTMFNIRVVGGSTAKPTSRSKKKEAVEVGQVIGQFAKAAPAAVIIMLEMFQQAFDDIVITDEKWQMLIDSMNQQLNSAGAGPGGEPGAEGQPPQQGAEGGGDAQQMIMQILQVLPPEAQAALQELVNGGTSPLEAIVAIIQQLVGGGQQQAAQ